MGEDSAQIGHTEAQAMLDAFTSVGATRFDVTWTTSAGDNEWQTWSQLEPVIRGAS
jgi:hypothetical protein